MHRPSEGMRRLGIVFGVVGALAWVLFVAIASKGFSVMPLRAWVILSVGTLLSFGLCFLAIWTVDWIIAGFRSER